MKKTILKDDNGKSIEVDLKAFLDHLNEYHKIATAACFQEYNSTIKEYIASRIK